MFFQINLTTNIFKRIFLCLKFISLFKYINKNQAKNNIENYKESQFFKKKKKIIHTHTLLLLSVVRL